MSSDARSNRVVAVMQCILNQSARAPRCAVYPGANTDLLEVLSRRGIGILQMPCPEMAFMGLARARDEGLSIRDVIDTPAGHECCREIARGVVDLIEDYLKNGCAVHAILGGDVGSPGCAVHEAESSSGRQALAESSGVLMYELAAELLSRRIDVPIHGVRDSSPETLAEDIAWVEARLDAAGA